MNTEPEEDNSTKDFAYFVSAFIRKSKQRRWTYFLKKLKWDKIGKLLHAAELDMNDKCTLNAKDGHEVFRGLIEKNSIRLATYIDGDGPAQIAGEIEAPANPDDNIIVCRLQRAAFFFSHEGWVTVCSEQPIEQKSIPEAPKDRRNQKNRKV